MHQGLSATAGGGPARPAFTLWFTGLSGSGKTTLSRAVYEEILRRGSAAEWLDGDVVRKGYGHLLGFTKRDRDVNVRCLGFISKLLNRHGVISVVGAIAPYAETRAQNREAIGANYIEVFCRCPIETAAKRDKKGLYKKAAAGEMQNFTGISDAYEAPESPEILLHTDSESVEACLARILGFLERRGLTPPTA